MRIIPLVEGIFLVDSTKVFTPVDPAIDQLADRAKGSVVVAVQPFLICTRQAYILLDTGLGPLADGELPILSALWRHHIRPEQISQVILSHLHKDHTGGIGHQSADGSYQMSFPQATYYLQERELAYARQQVNNPSYDEQTLAGLATHSQVRFLRADAGQIGGQIEYSVSGGHTPFHQTLLIREGGQTVFFGGGRTASATLPGA